MAEVQHPCIVPFVFLKDGKEGGIQHFLIEKAPFVEVKRLPPAGRACMVLQKNV